jgi:tetratricopeptide (TPR) repeat protein
MGHGAYAQPAISPAALEQAKQYVNDGIAAQNRGDYDQAIELYAKADAVKHVPVLIFDMAQAQRLAGRLDEARKLYEQYLSEAPTGSEAPTARDWINDIKRRTPPPAAPAPVVTPIAAPAQPETMTAVAVPALPGRNLRIAGIATAGVGTVSLAIGIGYWVHSTTLNAEIAKENPPAFDRSKDDAGHRANALAYAGGITGGALLIGGAALYYWGYQQGEQARGPEHITLAPLLSDHVAGLVVAGSMW